VSGPVDFNDDLHGIIHMEEYERDLVASPWFQRLRRIHQLGLANMVFPGAEHTRFAHSLGVFHLASTLGPRLQDAKCIDATELRELRAAALLHDIGHFPFSHGLESVYKAESKKADSTQAARAPLQSGDTAELKEDKEAVEPKFHESLGKQVIEQTTSEGGIARILLDNNLQPGRVGSIVVGQHENLLLNQVLHSDLDVDQLDYLLRDAKATGSTYGLYDVDYLLESLEVARVKDNPVLCVHVRALHTLEHYVLARYFYYVCILYQKTRCVIEALLQEIARRLIVMGHLPSWECIRAGFHEPWFCWFDDIAVTEAIRRVARELPLDDDLRSAIEMLLNRDRRRLPKVEHEEHRTDSDPGEPPSATVVGDGNPVVRAALCSMSTPEFTVLERRLRDTGTAGEAEVLDVLTSDPEPIRVFRSEPYFVPAGTPRVPATGGDGREGDVLLLESLTNSLVGLGKLAGQKTCIVRRYQL